MRRSIFERWSSVLQLQPGGRGHLIVGNLIYSEMEVQQVKLIARCTFAVLSMAAVAAAQEVPSAEVQVAAAVQAAPEDRRSGATVLGYDAAGALTTLRKGANDLICIADNPKADGFSAACYHKDLDAFMARGRELTAQGVADDRVRDQTRFKEIAAGTLAMAKEPRTLYVLSGKSYDAGTSTVVDGSVRWVIYVPFATAESTGLATKPANNAPWLMDPGTPGAHIMISPPRPSR